MSHKTLEEMHPISACLVNQAQAIAAGSSRLKALHGAVGDPASLRLEQWIHLFALVTEYRPDLIIELGRGFGNSTVAFAEALEANETETGNQGALLSLCNSNAWEDHTVSRLKRLGILSPEWLRRIDARRGDIVDFDFEHAVCGAKSVLVFWDAHGVEVADVVLARLMPLIANRRHLVLMHDISDWRYSRVSPEYQGLPFWRGQQAGWSGNSARLRLGWVDTVVEQAIPAIDFLTRNGLKLQSADHRVHLDLVQTPGMLERLRQIYPDGFFDPICDWAYFSLNEAPAPYTFPVFASDISVGQGEGDSAQTPVVSRLDEAQNSFFARSQHPIVNDLERSKWFGRRSPITYGRIIAKLLLDRY